MVAAGETTVEDYKELLEAVDLCPDAPNRMQITFTAVQVWRRKPKARGWFLPANSIQCRPRKEQRRERCRSD